MTSAERVAAALSHRQGDRTPLFEYVMHAAVAEKFLRRPLAIGEEVYFDVFRREGYEAAIRRRAVDMLDLNEFFDFDMLYFYPERTTLPAPQPASTPPAARQAAYAAGSPAAAPPIEQDPVEAIRARIASSRQRPPGLGDKMLAQYQALLDEITRRGLDLPVLVPCYVHGVWTDADLMQTMLLAPEVAEELFRERTRGALATVERFLAMGFRQIGVGGDFAGNRAIISAEAYRRFIVPEVRKLSDRIHAGGGLAINASDGDLWYVIDDFLTGCGADGYIEIDGQAGMDLRRLKERFGKRVTLYGNFDCMQVMCFARPDEVRRHAIETIEAGLGDGGHILCCNNAITSAVPVENYIALQQAYREYFALPKLKV